MKITVEKEKVLETLKTNREKHEHEYVEAVKEFHKAVLRGVTKAQERLKKYGDDPHDEKAVQDIQGDVRLVTTPTPPSRHTQDYDRAIQMVKWSTEDIVELDQDSFDSFVNDNWRWRHGFDNVTASNSSYLA